MASLAHNLSGTAQDQSYTYTRNQAREITNINWSNNSYQFGGVAGQLYNGTVTYTRNGLNQYTALTGWSLGYDSNGNTNRSGSTTLTYDANNRLRSASKTVAPALAAALAYDAEGRLRQTVINGVTVNLLYDGQDLVGEYDAAGALLRRHVHGPGVDEPLVTYEGTTTTAKNWLYADHLGSVIGTADATGTSTGIYSYGAYGEPSSPTAGPRFRYTGQQWIQGLGYYYYKARFYASGIGRFLQTDPIGMADDLNLYAYVGGNPVNRIDPTGLSAANAALLNGSLAGGAVMVAGATDEVLGQIFRGWGSSGLSIPAVPPFVAPALLGLQLLTFPSAIADGTLDGNGRTFNSGTDSTTPSPTEGVKLPTAEAPFPANPDNSKFPPIKGTGAKVNPADGSVWERDTSSHGGDQWKRWPDRKSWERGNQPNSIWPDGRVRK